MKIIVINPKKDFAEQQIKMLEDNGEVTFLETQDEYKNSKVLFEVVKGNPTNLVN